jgi:hypothetical protein
MCGVLTGLETSSKERLQSLVERGLLIRVDDEYNFDSFSASVDLLAHFGLNDADKDWEEFYNTYPKKEGNNYLRDRKSKCKEKYKKLMTTGLSHRRTIEILTAFVALKQECDKLYIATKQDKYWLPRMPLMSTFVNNLEDKVSQYADLIADNEISIKLFGADLK